MAWFSLHTGRRRLGHASLVQQSRILLVIGALAAAAIVVVVLIVVGSNGGSGRAATTTTAATTTSTTATTPTAASIFAGVPQHGDTLGKASAAVTLTVYEDPQCPFCAQWNLQTLPTVIERYIKPGRIKLVYRGVEIIGPNSVPGLRAIYAAGAQNKLWPLVEQLYLHQGGENSGWITPAAIRAAAAAAGANGKAILAASGSSGVTAALKQAETGATAINLQGTPTFVVERPPGLPQQLSVPALDPASFIPALDAALQ
jgi:protein-disulfide isomerase